LLSANGNDLLVLLYHSNSACREIGQLFLTRKRSPGGKIGPCGLL
jgi:hypothetical protein